MASSAAEIQFAFAKAAEQVGVEDPAIEEAGVEGQSTPTKQDASEDLTPYSTPMSTPQKPLKKQGSAKGQKTRADLLYEAAKEKERKQEMLRKQLYEESCTFKPNINSKSKELDTKGGQASQEGSRFETLYRRASSKREKQDEKRKSMETAGCTFKPKINEGIARKGSSNRPRYEELYDAGKSKKKLEELEKKKLEKEMEGCTFKPQTKQKKTPVKDKPSPGSFFDRLNRYQEEKEKKRELMRQKKLEEEEKELTFKPTIISPYKKSQNDGGGKAVVDRLYKANYAAEVAKKRKDKKLEEESKYKFKPQISSSKSPARPTGNIFERLYKEKEEKEKRLAEAEEAKLARELAECTFQPNADEMSPAKVLPSNGEAPVWERLASENKAEAIKIREEMKKRQELAECTFVPTISASPSRNVERSGSVFDRLAKESRNRDEEEEEDEEELERSRIVPRARSTPDKSASKASAPSPSGMFKELGSAEKKNMVPNEPKRSVTSSSPLQKPSPGKDSKAAKGSMGSGARRVLMSGGGGNGKEDRQIAKNAPPRMEKETEESGDHQQMEPTQLDFPPMDASVKKEGPASDAERQQSMNYSLNLQFEEGARNIKSAKGAEKKKGDVADDFEDWINSNDDNEHFGAEDNTDLDSAFDTEAMMMEGDFDGHIESHSDDPFAQADEFMHQASGDLASTGYNRTESGDTDIAEAIGDNPFDSEWPQSVPENQANDANEGTPFKQTQFPDQQAESPTSLDTLV